MKTTKILALTLALVLTLTLTACSDGSGGNSGGSTNTPPSETPSAPDASTPSPNQTQGNGDNDPGANAVHIDPGTGGPMPADGIDIQAHREAGPSDETWALIATVGYVDEQSGDVFVSYSHNHQCDSTEIFRGTKDYVYRIASLPGENPEDGYALRLYIDEGAAGKGYYYAVRCVAGDVEGFFLPPKSSPSASNSDNEALWHHENKALWYHGEDGYVRRTLRYSFENPAPDGKDYTELLHLAFIWFDNDGHQRDRGYFYSYTYFYYDSYRERGFYSQTHDTTRFWEHGFRGRSSDTNLLVNFDDETFEWANIFVEEESYKRYTVDSNIYTVY